MAVAAAQQGGGVVEGLGGAAGEAGGARAQQGEVGSVVPEEGEGGSSPQMQAEGSHVEVRFISPHSYPGKGLLG